MCAAVAVASMPAFASQADTLSLSVMSDLHYFPQEYIGSVDGYNYRCAVDNDRKLEQYSDEILDTVLADVAEKSPDYLIIPGDLVMSGQRLGHERVAAKLRALEQSGVQVYVLPGNHDVSQTPSVDSFAVDDASVTREVAGESYVVDRIVPVEGTSLDSFAQIYDGLGYGDDGGVISRHEGSLSYAAQLGDGYRLIAVDANVYDGQYVTKEKELTGGLLDWVNAQLDGCKTAGDVPLVMMHYNLIEKYPGQSVVMGNNYLPDRTKVLKGFAAKGVEYVFTGHSHANEVTQTTYGDNTVFEICTGSLLLHGSPYRFVNFNGSDCEISTSKPDSIEGIDDYQGFCESYYYPDGVRIMMRNRAVVVAAQTLAETFESDRLPYDEGYELFVAMMQGIIDGLLDMELDGPVTVCDLLSAAYRRHYAGDEQYTPEMQHAIDYIRSGEAFERALIIAFESIGEATGISQRLVAVSKDYRKLLRNAAAMTVLACFSNLLGAMGGEFLEGIFIDITPCDNNLSISGGVAYSSAGVPAPEMRAIDLFLRNVRIVIKMILCAVGIRV